MPAKYLTGKQVVFTATGDTFTPYSNQRTAWVKLVTPTAGKTYTLTCNGVKIWERKITVTDPEPEPIAVEFEGMKTTTYTTDDSGTHELVCHFE